MCSEAITTSVLSRECAERVNLVVVTLPATQTLHDLYFWKFPRWYGTARPGLAPPIWIALMGELAPAQRIKLTHILGAALRAGYRDLGELAEAARSGALVRAKGVSVHGAAFAKLAFRRPDATEPDAGAPDTTLPPDSAAAPSR